MLGQDGSLMKMGCISLTDSGDLFDRADTLVSGLQREIASLEDEIDLVIEEPLLRFAKGMSSASTLLTLNRFNGMVTHACWKTLGVKPDHLNVIFARRELGIKKDKGQNVKEVVMAWVASDVPSYEWPTKIISRGARKGQVIFEDFCYDVADAYVMAKARHVKRVKTGSGKLRSTL